MGKLRVVEGDSGRKVRGSVYPGDTRARARGGQTMSIFTLDFLGTTSSYHIDCPFLLPFSLACLMPFLNSIDKL
jgi:hypothetical protein